MCLCLHWCGGIRVYSCIHAVESRGQLWLSLCRQLPPFVPDRISHCPEMLSSEPASSRDLHLPLLPTSPLLGLQVWAATPSFLLGVWGPKLGLMLASQVPFCLFCGLSYFRLLGVGVSTDLIFLTQW